MSERAKGVWLVLISALVFSSAGLFVRGVEADAWSVIFWRGLFAALFSIAYVVWQGKLRQEFHNIPKPGIVAAVIGASGTAAFIPAFKLTTIANVSLIYAAAPFVAAVIMWFWIREKPTTKVIIASLLAFLGMLLIVSGSLGGVHLAGDLLALWMTVVMAIYMCIYRRYPDTPVVGPVVLSSVLLLPPALFFSDPFAAPLDEIVIMSAFGLVFAVASVTLGEGARRLPASETALVSALETPLAPVWAFFLFAEVPALLTVVGGAMILLAVFGSR